MKMFTGNSGQFSARFLRIPRKTFCIVLVVLFASCASPPLREKSSVVSFFSLFLPYEGAPLSSNDFYAVIPVSENKALLQTLTKGILTEKNTAELLERTSAVYLAYSLSFTNEFKLVAEGRFPKNLASFLFPKKRGWKKTSIKNSFPPPSTLPEYYEAKTGKNSLIQVSIPESGLAFAASGGMQTMLERSCTAAGGFVPDTSILSLLETPSSAVRFFIPDVQPHILRFFSGNLTLPVEYAAGVGVPVYEDGIFAFYDTTLYLKIIDSRFMRTAELLVRKVLKPFSGAAITIEDGQYLTIRGLSLSLETIERMR